MPPLNIPAVDMTALYQAQSTLAEAPQSYQNYVNNEPKSSYDLQPNLPARRQVSTDNLRQKYASNPTPEADRSFDMYSGTGAGIGAHYSASQQLTQNSGGSDTPGSWQRQQLHKKWGMALREKYHEEVNQLIGEVLPHLENGNFDVSVISESTKQRLIKFQNSLFPNNFFSNVNSSARDDMTSLDAVPAGRRAIRGVGRDLSVLSTHTDATLAAFISIFTRNTIASLSQEDKIAVIKKAIFDYQQVRSKELEVLSTYATMKAEALQERSDNLMPTASDEYYFLQSERLQQRLSQFVPNAPIVFQRRAVFANNQQQNDGADHS